MQFCDGFSLESLSEAKDCKEFMFLLVVERRSQVFFARCAMQFVLSCSMEFLS